MLETNPGSVKSCDTYQHKRIGMGTVIGQAEKQGNYNGIKQIEGIRNSIQVLERFGLQKSWPHRAAPRRTANNHPADGHGEQKTSNHK